MSLSRAKVEPTIAVTDMAKAKEFYEGKLGLSNGEEQADGGTRYPCGEGRTIHVYPSPDNAGKSAATLAAFEVSEIESEVAELLENGVTFEKYDGFEQDDKGIATMGDDKVAWMRDPDGNTLGVWQQG
jgi:catechol 2,3-dioxygenase-like lactoylglutathione lyase family enzyme